MPTLFVGLGPRQEVTEDDVREAFGKHGKISDMRFLGKCAFVDMETEEDCRKVIENMDGVTMGEASRLVVKMEGEGRGGRGGDRGGDRGGRGGGGEGNTLFIGLGPSREVTEDDLRDEFTKFGKIESIRFTGTCAFIDFEERRDAEKAKDEMDNKYIKASRLSVQWAKARGGGDRGGDRGGYGGDRGGDRGYDRPARRDRSDSRDYRRRRDDSRDYRRGRDRSDSRDYRRRRDRSDSREDKRRRRDRSDSRDGRRGGGRGRDRSDSRDYRR